MLVKIKRSNRIFRKKIKTIFLFELFLFLGFFIYVIFSLKNQQLISPLGKSENSAKIEKILKEKNISFSSIAFFDSSYVINIQNNGQVKLSSQKNIDNQIASLQRILRALTIEDKTFKSIDLRFKEPVISF